MSKSIQSMERSRKISLCVGRALTRLKNAHFTEYSEYYADELSKLGMEVNSKMKEIRKQNEILKQRIKELESVRSQANG